MYINLFQIKKHLNLDEGYDGDDEYLTDLAMVAELSVQRHIDHSLKDLEDENGNIPMPIVHAMLLLIGSLYAKRESVAFSSAVEMPHSYDYLLDLYKDYNGWTDRKLPPLKKEEEEEP